MIVSSRTLRVVALIAAAAVCLGAALWSGSLSVAWTSTPHRPAVPTAASNRRAAVRDAGRLLGLAPRSLPPGAVRLSAEPRGDHRLLTAPPKEPSAQIVDRFGWWRVPAPFRSVIAYIQAHPPRGPLSGQGASGFGGTGVPENEMLSFQFLPVGTVIDTRALAFSAVALRGGGTGVRVNAQETWVVPRRPSEKVPDGVRQVQITSARPGVSPTVSRTVTARAKVSRIVRLIDQMPILQPGVAYSCPALSGPLVTFVFRHAANAPILARASVTDFTNGARTPYGPGSGPCNPVSFSIRGHRQTPLIGGNFLAQVQRLLGVKFR